MGIVCVHVLEQLLGANATSMRGGAGFIVRGDLGRFHFIYFLPKVAKLVT